MMEKRQGIYCIINRINNKRYIGQSIDVYNRFLSHKTHLKNNNHENTKLQNDWEEHGKESFDFYIIEECSSKVLNKREQYYIKYYNSIKDGYNNKDVMAQNKLQRASFYLKPSTHKKLSKLAAKNDMYISEFLQKLLDETLDKIIIEE